MRTLENKDLDKEDILIRNYQVSDYRATLDILKELNVVYNIGLNEEKWKKTSGLRHFKPNLKRITLVAEEKSTGEILCMGVIEASKDTLGQYIGYLKNWATRWEYIGKNIGNILAEKAIQILRSWGCISIRISLGYNASDKLIDVFKNAGFNPIMIVLEKGFNKD